MQLEGAISDAEPIQLGGASLSCDPCGNASAEVGVTSPSEMDIGEQTGDAPPGACPRSVTGGAA